MELKTIGIDDVMPDPNNPRRDFGDLGALADSFELNANAPGEPVNPPVVVADGSLYRLIDGERRWRAIKKRGQVSEIHAIVCEDMDEANAMVSMLTTDDKEQLSDAERSRGVQQMLLLGVDPVKVERAGRMAKGSAARVRRAMDAAGSKAETMSLDFLLALDECESDEERYQLLRYGNDSFEHGLERIKDKREEARIGAAMEAAAEACGIALVGGKGELPEGIKYLTYVDWDEETFEEDLRKAIEAEAEDGAEGIVGIARAGTYSLDIMLYGMLAEGSAEESAEEAARREHQDAVMKAAKKAEASWFAFILAHADGSAASAVEWLCKDHISEWNRERIEKQFNVSLDDEALPVSSAAGLLLLYVALAEIPEFGGFISQVANEDAGNFRAGVWAGRRARRLLEWRAALDADGYEASAVEQELVGLVRRLCEQADAMEAAEDAEGGER